MEIPGLISLLKLFFFFNSRTNSHPGAYSNSAVNYDSVMGVNCDSQVNSDSASDSDRGIDSGAVPGTLKSAPESTQESNLESAPELIPNTESESGRSDSELPPLIHT